MTEDATEKTPTPATMDELEVESPRGESPAEDVSCAGCGAYRELVGPISFDGVKVEHGDMVCRPCARKRGVRKSTTDNAGEQPMSDETLYRVYRALQALAQAGENEDWSEGTSDPHIASESYTEAYWRLRSIDIGSAQ